MDRRSQSQITVITESSQITEEQKAEEITDHRSKIKDHRSQISICKLLSTLAVSSIWCSEYEHPFLFPGSLSALSFDCTFQIERTFISVEFSKGTKETSERI